MEEIISNISQTPENTNSNVLRSQLQSIAGDKLPPVGPDDKGKVLTTNKSTGAPEWAEANSGGGGGVMYATFTLIPQETPPDTWLCDKTAEEIVAALMAGTTVYAQHTDPLDVTTRLSVNYFTEDEFGAFVLFGGLIEQNEVQFARVGTGQDPEWTRFTLE